MINGKKQLFFPINFVGQLTSSTTEVDMKLSLTSKNDQAMINITGPDGKWFGVGLGAKTFTMSDQPYTIMVDGSGKVSELKLGDHSGGQTLAKSVTVVSNKVVNGRRTISLTRALKVSTVEKYNLTMAIWEDFSKKYFIPISILGKGQLIQGGL